MANPHRLMNQPQLKWAIGLTRVAVAFPRQRRYSFAFRCQMACRYAAKQREPSGNWHYSSIHYSSCGLADDSSPENCGKNLG